MRKKSFLFLMTLIMSGILLTASSITITEPNSGSNWILGKTHAIKWSKTGPQSGFVKIRLLNSTGTSNLLKITNKTPNNGIFSWTLSGINPGNYRIRVKTVDNKTFNDSQIFKIVKPVTTVKPEITITSPTGGSS